MKEHKACAIRNNLTDKDLEFMKLRVLKDEMLRRIPQDRRNTHSWVKMRKTEYLHNYEEYLLKCTNCKQTVLGYDARGYPVRTYAPARHLRKYILPCNPLKEI